MATLFHMLLKVGVQAVTERYTFELNDGIKCHDGTALDANDIKYTIEKAFDSENPSLTKGSWGPSPMLKLSAR